VKKYGNLSVWDIFFIDKKIIN